ncbi:MAG: RNA polymerase II mediator complex subunit [Candelina submexicana]|nr:MAG: RNA polymerase II mediator complex subunit [Candelina submexicana]
MNAMATATMSEALSLSLRSWPKEDPDSQSLPSKISRINAQKGSFRNITEESLEEEIRALEAGETHGKDEDATDEAQSAKGRREEITAAREEIVKQVGRAQTEALFALDFISLLLSKETPRQAELSMSPYLKQNAPMGSLGMDKMQEPPPLSDTETRDRDLVARGWKIGGLNSAADSLLQSATKLGQEMEQEARYWEQVLSVSEKGWSICRLPRERHTLGVRYGFAEGTLAAAEFKDRGLAALRRAGDGSITLDQGLSSSQPKAVRVRVQKYDTIIGTSTLPNIHTETEPSVEDLILRARNTIFEEELFHEITREARVLANQGVRNPGSTIQIPTSEHQSVLVDLVQLDEALPQANITTSNTLAESIALSLRILLSYAHRQALRRRSQLPPPITERKRPIPVHAILRPILSHLQHTASLSTLTDFLATLSHPVHSASLSFTTTTTTTTTTVSSLLDLSKSAKATAKPQSPTVETLVETLSRPLESTTTITLPSSTTVTLKMRTHLGTTYELTSPPSSMLSADLPPSMHFTSPSELRSYILYIVTLSLVSLVASYSPSASPESPNKDVAIIDGGEIGWDPSLQVGELTKAFNKFGRSKLLIVEVGLEKLGLRWGWIDGKGENGAFDWKGKDGEPEKEKRDFRDVVQEAGKDT